MRVWIDQNLCTGDGLCVEIAPAVFYMSSDGLAYVQEVPPHFDTKVQFELAHGNPEGGKGTARVPEGLEDDVIESADECPGECIFIESD